MRLRITDSLSDGYTERIVADDNGDLVRIERSYGRRFRASARAWITADPKIAERWANLTQFTRGASWKWLHETVGRQNVGSAAVQGTVPETRSLEGRNAIMKTILEQWDRPAPIIENVYESHPAVWVHESASVEPEARLIGPLWIGAGVRIGARPSSVPTSSPTRNPAPRRTASTGQSCGVSTTSSSYRQSDAAASAMQPSERSTSSQPSSPSS
ncbi:MAG: hypothetical protein ACFHWZ_09810 [Phycisphaerales bacterium]